MYIDGTPDRSPLDLRDDGPVPTEADLFEWSAPESVLADVVHRLRTLYPHLDGAKVRVVVGDRGLMIESSWFDDDSSSAHYDFLTYLRIANDYADARGQAREEPPYPLVPLVKGWRNRPIPVEANRKPARVAAGQLAMIHPGDRRAGRLFTPAAHIGFLPDGQQGILPGFGPSFDRHPQDVPALPLKLYDLGIAPGMDPGRGTPLALRMWVESILAVPDTHRTGTRAVEIRMPFREFLRYLYPTAQRLPKPARYYDQLSRAADILGSSAARIEWYDPDTGKGGARSIVTVRDLPRGPWRPR